MGVSGAAFRLAWDSGRWDGGNVSTLNIGHAPTEPIWRACGAESWVLRVNGYPLCRDGVPAEPPTGAHRGADYLGAIVGCNDEAAMRQMVKDGLRLRRYPLRSAGTIPSPGVPSHRWVR